MIISFKTASATTGARYTSTAGPTQVKFLFNDISTLEAYYSDFIASQIADNTAEDDMVEAKQFICGRLFKELWSDDIDNGFPMPKGCYYKKYGNKRELFVLFEAKNGLRPGKNYQVVMHGAVKDGAVVNGKYLEIFAMDDVSINPYIAIEHGVATLSTAPEVASTAANSPKWMNPGGFKVRDAIRLCVWLDVDLDLAFLALSVACLIRSADLQCPLISSDYTTSIGLFPSYLFLCNFRYSQSIHDKIFFCLRLQHSEPFALRFIVLVQHHVNSSTIILQVMGGNGNIVTLRGADALRIEMAGDVLFGISASSIVRIYLWPLTMWRTGSSCTAKCVSNDEVSWV